MITSRFRRVLDLLGFHDLLLILIPPLLIRVRANSLGEFPAVTPDLVPRQAEQCIHALKGLASSLGDEEPDPSETQRANDGAEVEEPIGVHLEQHGGYRLGVAELIDKMETHDEGRTEGTESDGVNLGVDQVLERVPAHSLACS